MCQDYIGVISESLTVGGSRSHPCWPTELPTINQLVGLRCCIDGRFVLPRPIVAHTIGHEGRYPHMVRVIAKY